MYNFLDFVGRMCSKIPKIITVSLMLIIIITVRSGSSNRLDNKIDSNNNNTGDTKESPCPCTCGIFLNGQFVKGSKQPPKGNPALLQEMDSPFMNNAVGNRQCMNKCLELVRGCVHLISSFFALTPFCIFNYLIY